MKRWLILLGVFGASASCVTLPPPKAAPTIYTAFDSSAVAWSAGEGTAIVEGQAFSKTRGGDVKYGAGNEVVLSPASPYSTEWYTATIQGEKIEPGPLYKYQRRTIADGSGHFEFESLPPGDYYITTSVTWEVPSSYGLHTTGGPMGAKVTATAGKTINVIVN